MVAFNNVSNDLRREADLYVSGFLVPNLLPIRAGDSQVRWGEQGSYAREFYTTVKTAYTYPG